VNLSVSSPQGASAPPQTHLGRDGSLSRDEHADVRPSPTGVAVYSDEGAREITLPSGSNGRAYLIDEFYDAVVNGVPPVHSGEFARGTVEASLAILESARQRREIVLRQ